MFYVHGPYALVFLRKIQHNALGILALSDVSLNMTECAAICSCYCLNDVEIKFTQ